MVNLVLILFWKAKRKVAVLTSSGRMFHRDGATAKKALLDHTSFKSLANGSVTVLFC